MTWDRDGIFVDEPPCMGALWTSLARVASKVVETQRGDAELQMPSGLQRLKVCVDIQVMAGPGMSIWRNESRKPK